MLIMYVGQTDNMLEFVTIDGKRVHLMKSEFNKVLNFFRMWRQDICGSNFSSKLFNLMSKADFENMQKFLTGFPTETIIYQLWYNSKTEDDFFRIWGDVRIGTGVDFREIRNYKDRMLINKMWKSVNEALYDK